MINTITEDMGIIEKYRLSPTELFVVRILMLASEEDDSFLARYFSLSEDVRGDFRGLLFRLQDKGILNKSYKVPDKGKAFDPYEVVEHFNKSFVKQFLKASFDMGKELFENYPMFGNINGNVVPLRGISKKFNSLEDFYRAYGKSINWNPETHKRIMECLNWAKENTQFIQFSLASFVVDRRYEELEALRNGDIVNVNYSAVKMI